MIVAGHEEVELATLELPEDIQQRMQGENAQKLAKSLRLHGGYLHDPAIRLDDRRIIAGRDRIAGALIEGRTHLMMKLVQCSDAEAEQLEIEENLHRRAHDDRPAMLRRWLDIEEQRLAAEPSGPEKKGAGRTTTPRGEARERLAQKLGVTKNAVEKADRPPKPPAIDDEPGAPPLVDTRKRVRCNHCHGTGYYYLEETPPRETLLRAPSTKKPPLRVELEDGDIVQVPPADDDMPF